MVDKILLHYLFREISRYLFARDIKRYRELLTIFENEIKYKKNVTQSVKKNSSDLLNVFIRYKFHKYICYCNCNNPSAWFSSATI